ncbi:hypothetical protein R0J90_21970, partial [Micrococcus sp. SIMBA_144]
FAQQKAKDFNDHGFTVKAFGREMIFRAFGEEEANRVYPQERGKGLSEASKGYATIIESVILSLLRNKEWTTGNEIVLAL